MSSSHIILLVNKIIKKRALEYVKKRRLICEFLPLTKYEKMNELQLLIAIELSKINMIEERIKIHREWLKYHEPGYLRHLEFGGYFSENSKRLIEHNKIRIKEDEKLINLRTLKINKIKTKLNYLTQTLVIMN